MADIVEIRSYNLKPGHREEFHRLFTEETCPMLKRWKVDVVAFGPSPQDNFSYYLIRRYNDLSDLEQSQEDFYGSDFFFQAEGGIRDGRVTGVQTCALPISQPFVLATQPVIVEGAAHRHRHLRELEGLSEIVVGALPHRRDGRLQGAEGRHEDHARGVPEIGRASRRERGYVKGVRGQRQGEQ